MAKKNKKIPAERNPFVQHLVNRSGGGVHGQSPKAKRAQAKAKIKAGQYD